MGDRARMRIRTGCADLRPAFLMVTVMILLVSAYERPLGSSENGEGNKDQSKIQFHRCVWMTVAVVVVGSVEQILLPTSPPPLRFYTPMPANDIFNDITTYRRCGYRVHVVIRGHGLELRNRSSHASSPCQDPRMTAKVSRNRTVIKFRLGRS
jgi:hypothetical protein